jgi:transposase
VEARLANLPPCLIGMEACVGAHHLRRKRKPNLAQLLRGRPDGFFVAPRCGL